MVQMLRDKILNYDIGMFEQNVIAYLVMQQPDLLQRITFETDYCINCWCGTLLIARMFLGRRLPAMKVVNVAKF